MKISKVILCHACSSRRSSHRTCFAFVCLCVLIASSCSAPRGVFDSAQTFTHEANDEDVDAALQRAATAALGTRDGSLIVLDPQTGRVRAVVNARVAFEEALPPGSAIKPFTTLAALRAGLIDKDARVLCRTVYKRDDFATRCSHLKLKPPFDPAHALAYSCNYYFSKLGEKLNAEQFSQTLARFGFGAHTGSDDEREAAGTLPRNEWRVPYALGFGDAVRVTPAQLITAYAALFNGGHLYVPQRATSQNFIKQERATLEIAQADRALLLEGLRGAVAYGTASQAGLNSLPQLVFGKTGTSLPREDFRTHGWFIGFAADRLGADRQETESAEKSSLENLSPASVRLAVLVFLKHAHGAECAGLARNIFAAYTRAGTKHAVASSSNNEEAKTLTREQNASSAFIPRVSAAASSVVRVRQLREETTQTLSLDDYVFGVLAAESSTENNLEALKAQAIVSRSYALKNAPRHARDNYDFCNNTHCQRYIYVADETTRTDFYTLLHRAIKETNGEVLLDGAGRLADAYFSASCGGMTANIGTLWGKKFAPAYLRGVPDESCASEPVSKWTNVIPRAQLSKALRVDVRSDVGARLNDVRVVKRDATGRAEMIALEGERRRTLRGWDFKIIVGRYLGWDMLKSSRFDVTRAGDNFIFRGNGFGHGLGLCQAGAHRMAQRGASYRRILNQYFPGTRVGDISIEAKKMNAGAVLVPARVLGSSGDTMASSFQDARIQRAAFVIESTNNVKIESTNDVKPLRASSREGHASAVELYNISSPRLILAGENFRVSYPPRAKRRDVEEALRILEAARVDLSNRLRLASVSAREAPKLELFVHDTTSDFAAATGQPVWVAAATRGTRIDAQPLETLRKRGILVATLRHEYAHAIIDVVSRGHVPHWLGEGLAMRFAGEGRSVNRNERAPELSLDELEKRLTQRAASPQEMRALYAMAYRQVAALIRREGEASVWSRLVR